VNASGHPRVAIAYDCLFPVDTGGGERVYRRMAELFAERGGEVSYLTRDGREQPDAPFAVVGLWRGEIADREGTRHSGAALGFAWALFCHLLTHRRRYDLVVVAALPVLNVLGVRCALLGSRVVIATDWLEIWHARRWREYSGAVIGTVAWVLQWCGIRVGHIQSVNSDFTRARMIRYRPRADPLVLGLIDLVAGSVDDIRVGGDARDGGEAARGTEVGVGDAGAAGVGDAGAVGAAAREAGTGDSAPMPDAPTNHRAPFMLSIGRHIPDKQMASLPGALARARRDIPELVAVIAGTGPDTDLILAAARDEGMSGQIQLVGRVSDREIASLLNSAAVLVHPSRREGFGLVIAEAAAHGTPSVVVAGSDNAAAELVVNGVNGFVAASVAPHEMGGAIVRVLRADRSLRESTRSWFERERVTRSLGGSVDEILRRWQERAGERSPRATRGGMPRPEVLRE